MTPNPQGPDDTNTEQDMPEAERPMSDGAPGAEIGLTDEDEGSSFEPEEDQ